MYTAVESSEAQSCVDTAAKSENQDFDNLTSFNAQYTSNYKSPGTYISPSRQRLDTASLRETKEKMNKFQVSVSDFIVKNDEPIKSVYRIGRRIGQEGSYGYVRFCIHRNTGCLRAVKVIEKSSLSNIECDDKNIINEIEILKFLDHPAVMRIYEYFEDTQRFYIISDMYQGGELYSYIEEKIKERAEAQEERTSSVVPENVAKKIMRQIIGILVYLRQKNIVHRDIKPENLMFVERGNVDKGLTLIDFGFAKRLAKDDTAGNMAKCEDKHGTAYYIAPEIVNFVQYDYKCDIWSAGVILYIMLTGKPPFNGKEVTDIQGKIKNGSYKMRKKDFVGVSQQAQNFLRRLMTFD